ncbi:MAG: DUF3667 domain-containing protein [Ferruginibacter sp.]
MQQQNLPITCPSCEHIITENFCSHCGEKKVDHHDFLVKHFLEETIEGLTHFDNKFFRSSKLLITRPGLLTKYYFEGRRMRFMKPLQLFIVCNIIFFFLLGKTNVFARPFYNYKNFAPFTYFGTRQIIAAKAQTEEQVTKLAAIFDERIITQSKAFLIFFIPFFSLFFSLLFLKKNKYFTEHLVFATHYFSFLLMYYIVFRYLVELPFSYFSNSGFNAAFDLISSLGSLLLLSIYFMLAVKRFYNISNVKSIASGILVAVIFTIGMAAYRMFLFYKIMYSIHS